MDRLRTLGSPALVSLGGEFVGHDPATGEVTMTFRATPSMCHSEVIVQGGYVTGMLDAAIAFAGFAAFEQEVRMASLDINVSFLEAGNPGELRAVARPVRLGRTIGFFSAELHQAGRPVATATSTVRLVFVS